MNVRRLFLSTAVCAALALATAVQAQDEKKGRGRGMPTVEQRIERLEETVGKLTGEQKDKIKEIYAKTAEKMREIPAEERREKMMEVMRESQKEVRAVLTSEQQKKFDEMAPQRRGSGGARKQRN